MEKEKNLNELYENLCNEIFKVYNTLDYDVVGDVLYTAIIYCKTLDMAISLAVSNDQDVWSSYKNVTENRVSEIDWLKETIGKSYSDSANLSKKDWEIIYSQFCGIAWEL